MQHVVCYRWYVTFPLFPGGGIRPPEHHSRVTGATIETLTNTLACKWKTYMTMLFSSEIRRQNFTLLLMIQIKDIIIIIIIEFEPLSNWSLFLLSTTRRRMTRTKTNWAWRVWRPRRRGNLRTRQVGSNTVTKIHTSGASVVFGGHTIHQSSYSDHF